MNKLIELITLIIKLFQKSDPMKEIVKQTQPKFKDDSERLKREWRDLDLDNPKLKQVVLDVVEYMETVLEKEAIITMIYRTQQEQDEIYAGKRNSKGREYNKNPWTSPHQYAHAVDLRNRHITKQEAEKLEDYINAKYNMTNYYNFTAMNHDIGRGDHLHIQYVEGE